LKTPGDDKNLIALAGEYHVLAQLAEQGIVGALTLGHTKGIDILAHNPRTRSMRRVEVKSTRQGPRPARLWHPDAARVYSWPMSHKHEAIDDRDLLFCFLHLRGAGTEPIIFVVPGIDVAQYVRWENRLWRKSGRNGTRTENTIRMFRIEEADPCGYRGNWAAFE
jgi:hypothetical protein